MLKLHYRQAHRHTDRWMDGQAYSQTNQLTDYETDG